MLTDRELTDAIGTTAYDPGGDEVGTVEHFFVDDRTGAPTWVAVTSGLFGTRHAIVPVVDATFADGALRLPVSREAVRAAPHLQVDRHLDPGEEEQLRRHYGLVQQERSAGEPGVDAPGPAQSAGQGGGDGDIERGDGGMVRSDGGMVRSEEQLRVATEQVATTRVRVVKYVVTEEVQITVPVRREEIRVEEVPLDAPEPGPGESLVPEGRHAAPDDGPAVDAAAPSAGTGLPDEIVLHREEPVVSVRVVPAERVRLRTEVVEGEERITSQVQRERIVVDETPAPR